MRCFFLFCCLILALCAAAQDKPTHQKTFRMASDNPGDDSITMKEYFFVMLTKGKDRDKITDTAVINKLQAGHMANITRLYKQGKILVAGPFGDNGDWRGIFIFDCETKEECEALLQSDPMIKAGRLGYEVHPWWTGMNSVFK